LKKTVTIKIGESVTKEGIAVIKRIIEKILAIRIKHIIKINGIRDLHILVLGHQINK